MSPSVVAEHGEADVHGAEQGQGCDYEVRDLGWLFSLLQNGHQASDAFEHEEGETDHVPVLSLVDWFEAGASLTIIVVNLSHGVRACENYRRDDNENASDEALSEEREFSYPGQRCIHKEYDDTENPQADILALS